MAAQTIPFPGSLGQRIHDARVKAGISQAQLAQHLHVTRVTVQNWECGKTSPVMSLAPELCRQLGISLTELYGMREDASLSQAETRILQLYRGLKQSGKRIVAKLLLSLTEEEEKERADEDHLLQGQHRLIAFFETAAAAGTGNLFTDQASPECMIIRRNLLSEKADAVIRVSGHSMEPVYPDGCQVYIRYADSARPGQDVVCSTNDGAVIKRLGADMTLYSVNPDYPFGEKTEDDAVRIHGVVLGIVQEADLPSGKTLDTLTELMREEIASWQPT